MSKATDFSNGKRGQFYPESRTITLYRDDSTVQVVYKNVKHFFWTAHNTILTIAQVTDVLTGEHRYIHWPRERFCWFKDEKGSP